MTRQHERREHFTEIILESASGRREARMTEVSMGGCFIESIADSQVGEGVSFEIKDHDPPVRFTGNIAYTLPGVGFGVRFTEFSQESSEYLLSVFGWPDG
jgi:hypothetical protein